MEEAVHRIGAPPEAHGVVEPFIGGEVLFGPELTGPAFTRRYKDGAAVLVLPAGGVLPPGSRLLFVVRRDGRLDPVTDAGEPLPQPGDRLVLLAPGGRGTTQDQQ